MSSSKHRIGLAHYVWTYATLLALASLSLGLSWLPDTAAVTASLLIAGVKAALVLMVFMHLLEESFTFRFVMMVATLLVCILVGLTALDPLTRAPYPPVPSQNASYRVASGN